MVGILLFAEYPTTIVYATKNNTPVIREWVDCSEDGFTERFFSYATTVKQLQSFLQGRISHKNFIKKAEEGIVYFEDVADGNTISTAISSTGHLPLDYLPADDFYITPENAQDLEVISNYFSKKELRAGKRTDRRILK